MARTHDSRRCSSRSCFLAVSTGYSVSVFRLALRCNSMLTEELSLPRFVDGHGGIARRALFVRCLAGLCPGCRARDCVRGNSRGHVLAPAAADLAYPRRRPWPGGIGRAAARWNAIHPLGFCLGGSGYDSGAKHKHRPDSHHITKATSRWAIHPGEYQPSSHPSPRTDTPTVWLSTPPECLPVNP